MTLLYRVRDRADLVFKRELDLLAERTGARIHYLVGGRRFGDAQGPLSPATIDRLVPNVASHEVYICGPNGLMTAAAASVMALGVPTDRIHQERFFD